jgi:hypothetical protein
VVLEAPGRGGVFDHLLPHHRPTPEVVGATMTWAKFVRDVLPNASKLEVKAAHRGWLAVTTAAHADAPPLFHWDHPFSWYTYAYGSDPAQWGMRGLVWREVLAVTPMPNRFTPGHEHHSEGVMLHVKDCRDTRHSGAAIFPEHVRGTLRPIRSAIEAYSKSGMLGLEDGAQLASGLAIRGPGSVTLRATTSSGLVVHTVDRLE